MLDTKHCILFFQSLYPSKVWETPRGDLWGEQYNWVMSSLHSDKYKWTIYVGETSLQKKDKENILMGLKLLGSFKHTSRFFCNGVIQCKNLYLTYNRTKLLIAKEPSGFLFPLNVWILPFLLCLPVDFQTLILPLILSHEHRWSQRSLREAIRKNVFLLDIVQKWPRGNFCNGPFWTSVR